MKYLQPYYLLAFLIGVGIFWYDASNRTEASLFYGFAENKETEVNFNYPVIVTKIMVSEGQQLSVGDLMIHLQRIQAKEQLADEDFKINELQAQSRAWVSGKQGDLERLKAKYNLDIQDVASKINMLAQDLEARKRLYSDLKALKDAEISFESIESEIAVLEEEKDMIDSLYWIENANLRKEISMGTNPFLAEIGRLEAKKEFDVQQQVQDIEIRAPFEGLVGNISCKEAEHIPSFKTLLTYYEPNPSMVKGYIHEDLIMKVNLQDTLLVRSTKDAEVKSTGVVTGMGSRIVEIPLRLRRIPDMKTYGREVLISIPSDNTFIQKEKVIIEFL